MIEQQHTQEAAVAVAKLTPPVAMTGWLIAGHPLADWLILATLVYTTLQIVFLLHGKWVDCRKERKK